jgi:thiol:disulfide interchange protein DsbD
MLLLPWVALLSLPIQAQVTASLGAADASLQPGRPATLVLHLEHQAGWRTFWINPGSGAPTTILWDLPPGWTTGAVEWPVPALIKNSSGQILGQGYSGVLDLAIPLSVPSSAAVGTTVALKARANWYMCADTCKPGTADLALSLPVLDTAPEPNALTREALGKRVLPEPLPAGWQITATQSATAVTLMLAGHGGFRGPRFFSEDAYIQYDQPQLIAPAAGQLSFTLPVAEGANRSTSRLIGVLGFTDANSVYHGVRVDVALPKPAKP